MYKFNKSKMTNRGVFPVGRSFDLKAAGFSEKTIKAWQESGVIEQVENEPYDPREETKDEQRIYTEDELENELGFHELKALAKKKGLAVSKSTKKDELITQILESQE